MTSTSDSSTSSYRIRSVLWPSEPGRGQGTLLRVPGVSPHLVHMKDSPWPQLGPDKSTSLGAGTLGSALD